MKKEGEEEGYEIKGGDEERDDRYFDGVEGAKHDRVGSVVPDGGAGEVCEGLVSLGEVKLMLIEIGDEGEEDCTE